MDIFLSKPAEERKAFIQESANSRNLPPHIIEKDFWVCWTLGQLFSLPDFGSHLVFKGGTSLSKGYQLIKRFSEDIDLSFHREFLGIDANNDPENASGKGRVKRLEKLKSFCDSAIKTGLLPALKSQIGECLPNEQWELKIDVDNSQTILFRYPQTITHSSSNYLRPLVKIELGARSDRWPTEMLEIRPYITDDFSTLQNSGCCRINVLKAERTFWEKATLIHAEHHRDQSKPLPSRLSRHYYDLDQMAANTELRKQALNNIPLLKRVVEHKQIYFESKWANYEEARPGTFCLTPSTNHLDDLRADYKAMQEMFFSAPPTFESILKNLKQLEQEINKL